MGLKKMPDRARAMIRLLYNIGYDALEMRHLYEKFGVHKDFVSDHIHELRKAGLVTRNSKRGKPVKRRYVPRLPKRLIAEGMVRLKHPYSGEVKLVVQASPLWHQLKKYGWTPATLLEFRTWHMRKVIGSAEGGDGQQEP